MNQDQDNTTTMFETTNKHLDDNKTIWQTMPAMVDAVNRVETGLAAIREKQGDQAPTGDTLVKKNARDDAEDRAIVIGGMLAAFAAKTNDPALAAKVDFDKSQLDRMAVSKLIIALKAVQTAATANAAVLASDYLVTAGDVTDFGAAITKLDGLKDAPRNAQVERKVATMSLPDAIAYVRSIYRNEIDKMMQKFKATQPDFYQGYFAARVIIDRPGTHKAKKKTTGGQTPPQPASP